MGVGSAFLHQRYHNVLSISYYPGDTAFFRYWRGFGDGFASPSLIAFQEKHVSAKPATAAPQDPLADA